MAQTKRKRQTKHRGNAAGVVEARGRTGRPPTPEERKRQQRDKTRLERQTTPPTWMSSLKRALLACGFMFVILLFISPSKKGSAPPVVQALILAVIALLIYAPAGYYLETFLYRRRMAKLGRPVPPRARSK
jgi:peptidoglycan/LPS O-acetylase OafA/YrhL